MSEQAYFVWLSSPSGPVRQKWAQDEYKADAYWRDRVLTKHPISHLEFSELTLDELTQMYPAPTWNR